MGLYKEVFFMRHFSILKFPLVCGLIAALFFSSLPVTAANAVITDEAKAKAGTIVPGRYVIRFKDNDRQPDVLAAKLGHAHGFAVRHIYSHAVRGMAIEIKGANELRILNALSRNPNVQSIGNDRYIVGYADLIPTGVDRIYGFSGPGGSNKGTSVRVAVADSGIDFNHPDLIGRVDVALSVDCMQANCPTGQGQDDNGHGSHVSGIIAASENTTGVVGVAPEATLISVKVLGSDGSGSFSGITAGIDYLAGLTGSDTVQVVNMSIGAFCSVCTDGNTSNADPEIQTFHNAVIALVETGVTVVVAAGNESGDAQFAAPASFDEVITVAALTDTDGLPGGTGGSLIFPGAGRYKDDNFAKFSNYGDDIDVIAPGVNIESVLLNGGTTKSSGTSMASPHVAGMAAIYARAYKDAHGTWPSPALVKQALIETGECADGNNGNVFHDGVGCSQQWSGDPDNIAEPLARADKVVNFGPPTPVNDVAVTSISAPSPVFPESSNSVSVAVTNEGTETESFDITLHDDLDNIFSTQPVLNLSAGGSTTLTFNWSPTAVGTHTLTATASDVSGETDIADNVGSTTSEVTDPVNDVAVTSVSAPATVSQGDTVTVTANVTNEGTFSETFTVTLSDTTGSTIGPAPAVTLTPGSSTGVGFSWATDGSTALGDHTLTAIASTVTGETDTVDNTASAVSSVKEPAAGLSIVDISPGVANSSDNPIMMTITGSGFIQGASITFENGSGKSPSASDEQVTDGTTLDASVTVSYKGPNRLRVWDVRVTNPDGGTDVIVGGLTVQP